MKSQSDHILAQLSHAELIRRLTANPGDAAVAREFISRYGRCLRQTIAAAVNKWMAAAGYARVQIMIEDLVNETYCRLFQNDCQVLRAFKCRYENSVFAYLRTIALSVVSNQMRLYRRQQALEQLHAFDGASSGPFDGTLWDGEATVADFNSAANQAAECKALEQTVHAGFHAAFRDANVNRNFIIFKLHFLHGYRSHEIACIKGLGLSERGIGNTAGRIRQWLRQNRAQRGGRIYEKAIS
jgi:DNA-directed RNA polymerase specialized sigma24 family protein